MEITTTAIGAFGRIFIDLVGTLTFDEKGNQYILTIQCELSKYIGAVPIFYKESNTIARSLVEHIILCHGILREIGSERRKEFTGSIFSDMCQILNIKHIMSTA